MMNHTVRTNIKTAWVNYSCPTGHFTKT